MRNDLASITQQTPTMVQEQLALRWLGEAISELGLGRAVDESDVLLEDVVLQESDCARCGVTERLSKPGGGGPGPPPRGPPKRGGWVLTVSCSGRSHTGRATRITCKGRKGCASKKIQGLGKQQHEWDQDFTRAFRKRKRSSPASEPAATIGGGGSGPSWSDASYKGRPGRRVFRADRPRARALTACLRQREEISNLRWNTPPHRVVAWIGSA